MRTWCSGSLRDHEHSDAQLHPCKVSELRRFDPCEVGVAVPPARPAPFVAIGYFGYRISVPCHVGPDCDGAGQVRYAVVPPMYPVVTFTRMTTALPKGCRMTDKLPTASSSTLLQSPSDGLSQRPWDH